MRARTPWRLLAALGFALRLLVAGVLASAAGGAQAQMQGTGEWDRVHQFFQAHYAAGRLSEAIETGRRLVRLSEQTLPPLNPRMGVALWSLGLAYQEQGQPRLAEPLLRRAVAITERMPAPPAGTLASMLVSLARICADEGRTEEAERLYARATSLLTPTADEDRGLYARLLFDQGAMYVLIDRPEQADPLLRDALARREALAGPQGSSSVAQVIWMLGVSRVTAKDPNAAIAHFNRALEMVERQPRRNDSVTGALLNDIAAAWVGLGQPEKAEEMQKRAVELLGASTSSNNRALARGLATLAQIQSAAGDLDGASASATRSLELRQLLYFRDDPVIGDTLDLLAGIKERQGRADEAAPLRARALQIKDKMAARRADPLATQPSYTTAPRVAYPADARENGYEGKVVVRVLVSADGTAAFVTVVSSSGYGTLDEAATRSVLGMLFKPAQTRGGVAVPAAIQIPIEYRLPPAAPTPAPTPAPAGD